MMQAFLSVLNMSIASTILLAMVLVWRWALRQYGAAGFRCLVWLPFLFRLLVPYSFPSGFSVYNLIPGRLEKPGGALLSIAYLDTAALGEQSLAAGQNLAYKQLLGLACGIWAAGAAAMLLYMAAQYLWQRISLTTAYRLPENETASYAARAGQRKPSPVLCTGAVRGPLVFGLVHPRVLLPLSLWEQPHGREYILLHEFTHIRWGDHVVLMAANLALALHWFNPLVWLARRRMAQDIERACDARVLRGLERQQQLAYAQALVDWAGRRSGWNGYAAFGDRDVSQRVRGVLAWKRLPRWAELLLGAIDDESWVWLNGTFLGEITRKTNPKDYWTAVRSYSLKPGVLKAGRNVLIVLCNDIFNTGGILGVPQLRFPVRWHFYADLPQSGDNPYQYFRW